MATELTPGVPLERKGNVSCLLQGCGCYGLIWLAVPSFQGLLNLCITSRPLLAISDMHLSSVRKKIKHPKLCPSFFFSRMGSDPLLFYRDFEGVGTFAFDRAAESSESCYRSGKKLQNRAARTDSDKQKQGQRHFAAAVLPPGALRKISAPALKGSAQPGAGAGAEQAAMASVSGTVPAARSHTAHPAVITVGKSSRLPAGIPPQGQQQPLNVPGCQERGCPLQHAACSKGTAKKGAPSYPEVCI